MLSSSSRIQGKRSNSYKNAVIQWLSKTDSSLELLPEVLQLCHLPLSSGWMLWIWVNILHMLMLLTFLSLMSSILLGAKPSLPFSEKSQKLPMKVAVLNDWVTFGNVTRALRQWGISDSFTSVGLRYFTWKYKHSWIAQTVPQSNCHRMSTVTSSLRLLPPISSSDGAALWALCLGENQHTLKQNDSTISEGHWTSFLASGIYILNGEPLKLTFQVMKTKLVWGLVRTPTELNQCQSTSVLFYGISDI